MVRALVKGKADPNRRNKVRQGQGLVVRIIDPSFMFATIHSRQSGGLPLTIASWKGHVPVVRVLLEESVKKCKVNKFSMVGPWVGGVYNSRPKLDR